MLLESRLSQTGSRRVAAVPCAAALAFLAACPGGRDVAVGAGDALNLGECSGAATDCKTKGNAPTTTSVEPTVCDATSVGTLQEVFRVDLQQRLCAGSTEDEGCSVKKGRIAVDADGSLWSLATVNRGTTVADSSAPALWLLHHSAEGTELGAAVIANFPSLNLQYEADVAALPDGEAAVVVYAYVFLQEQYDENPDFEEHTWVQRYHSDVSPKGGNVNLAAVGLAGIASTRDAKLLVLGDAPKYERRGVLALLDGSTLLWNQTNLPSVVSGPGAGAPSLSVDAQGRTTIVGVNAFRTDSQSFDVIRFDAQGNRLWNVTLSGPTRDGTFGLLAGDAAGNSTAVTELPMSSSSDAGTFLVHNLDASGGLRSSYRFESVAGFAVEPDSGHVFVMADPSISDRGVYDIVPDGSSCRRYSNRIEPFHSANQRVRGDSIYLNAARLRLVANE